MYELVVFSTISRIFPEMGLDENTTPIDNSRANITNVAEAIKRTDRITLQSWIVPLVSYYIKENSTYYDHSAKPGKDRIPFIQKQCACE